jgi:hypothetical protein
MKQFNSNISDSQSTQVVPVKPEEFDFDGYADYSDRLNQKCAEFWKAESGVMVYRRMRVAECFSFGCRDMKFSLENQLGALKKSMHYKSDVPNFLEPWYGIGTIPSAFGGGYIWPEGNAPAMKPDFGDIDELLSHVPQEVSKTSIGMHTLDMINYFMEKTKGRLPVSLTDIQSPLNMVASLIPLDQFFFSMMVEPEKALKLFDELAELSMAFNNEQVKLIGNSLVYPGHGFASSVKWSGLGMSDDNAIMISPEQYLRLAVPSIEKISKPFGGPVFHSCGDWSNWIDVVLKIKGLCMADGAFSPETDPGATTNLEAYHRFAGTGIIINARIVGNFQIIEEQVRRLWVPGMKLVVVTYCPEQEEQARAFDMVHEICI